MRILIFGAGPLGTLYARLLFEAGKDVTLLARGERLAYLMEHGLVLVDEFTGERIVAPVKVVDRLKAEDVYDLVIVLIRRNKLGPVFPLLAQNTHIDLVLFMGNNVPGFDDYFAHLDRERVLFGFPGAGGSVHDQVARFVDCKKPGGRRLPVTIEQPPDIPDKKIRSIEALFRTSDIPVDLVPDMDGWLKYHAALVLPIAGGLYRHDCDSHALARDPDTIHLFIGACKEAGRVLNALGFTRRQPFSFNLFYWLPGFLTAKAFQALFDSKFAEIAFSLHARAARDEMRSLAADFRGLIEQTSVKTPNFDRLMAFIEG